MQVEVGGRKRAPVLNICTVPGGELRCSFHKSLDFAFRLEAKTYWVEFNAIATMATQPPSSGPSLLQIAKPDSVRSVKSQRSLMEPAQHSDDPFDCRRMYLLMYIDLKALYAAVKANNAEDVENILATSPGLDIHSVFKHPGHKDDEREPVLHIALFEGNVEIVQSLIDFGASLDKFASTTKTRSSAC